MRRANILACPGNLMHMSLLAVLLYGVLVSDGFAQQAPRDVPEWCSKLPRPEYRSLERVQIASEWFEVYRIRPGVFAIYEPHQQEEVISYLILGERTAALFDTGMGIDNIRKIVDTLTKLPIIVLNSHTHNDHVGGNWQFTDVYSMDTAFTRANARGSFEDAQAELAPGLVCGALPSGFDAKSHATRPFRVSRWLHGGDLIDLGGRKLEVIATPGHTPDAICLLDRENGLLFTGDTFYAGPIYLFRPETNLEEYLRSVQKLAGLVPRLRLLLPAHNVPAADPAILPKVAAAFQAVRDGKTHAAEKDGKKEYRFEGFSFLMRK